MRFWLPLFLAFLATSPARAEVVELPVTGVWNSYLRQLNILECSNTSETPYDFVVTMRSNAGVAIGSQPVSLPAYGSIHIALNAFAPADAYGTFLVEHASRTFQSDSPLNCATVIYRFPDAGATRAVDYAFALPVRNAVRGASSGIFNSMNPQGGTAPVQNWLSVFNPGTVPFSASIAVFDQDGNQDATAGFFIADLQPGERRDFGLGHTQGQVLGTYRIVPADDQAPYGAFITRYGFEDNGRAKFAFPVHAKKGSCSEGAVPASTMDPAVNWGEVANTGDTPLPVVVEVRDAVGMLKLQEAFTLAPHSQRHVFINASLGERRVGTFEVRCAGGDLLVQSAYYGQRASLGPLVEWAYVSQAQELRAGEADRVSFLINTFFGAANWNKYLDTSEAPSMLNSVFYDGGGSNIHRATKFLIASGGIDLGLHEVAGVNVTGQVLSYSQTSSASINSELLRVFPDSRGGIGTIFNMPPRIIRSTAKQRGALRVANEGHWLEFRGKKFALVGDSITQGWMELGSDFNTIPYLDNLKDHGINALMIWSYIGILNQSQDARIGYHAPRRWPWPEFTRSPVPPYSFTMVDQFLRPAFDENYFTALRDLVKAANERDIVVLITVFDGWTKERFSGHPFNAANGGTLFSNRDFVNLFDYNRELGTTLNPAASLLERHQFLLERFSDRLIRATADFPNVMYEMFNEGEWYDQSKHRPFQVHFLDFFKDRTDLPLVVNDDGVGGTDFKQEANTDILALHDPDWNSSTSVYPAFDLYFERFTNGNPLKRPYLFDEPVPEYRGSSSVRNALMRLMWGTVLGGAGFFMPNDSSWKFDPADIDPIFPLMEYAARFLNETNLPLSEMIPDPNCASTEVCLTKPGHQYVVYSQGGAGTQLLTVNLANAFGTFEVRFWSPRAGIYDSTVIQLPGGDPTTSIIKPSIDDWVVWVRRIA